MPLQLFISVVCFGFENLDEQLSEPTFSDAVIGKPYVELETDPDDNLCKCLNKPVNPLQGAKEVELDRGERTGIRVEVNFKYHYFAPVPLNIKGAYDSAVKSEVMVSANPCFEVQSSDIPVGVPVPKVSPQREVSSSEQVSPTATMLKVEAAGAGNGMEHAAQSSEESEDREQRYWKYRKLMQKWKDEEKQRLEDIKNAPFQIAQGDCYSYVPDSIY